MADITISRRDQQRYAFVAAVVQEALGQQIPPTGTVVYTITPADGGTAKTIEVTD